MEEIKINIGSGCAVADGYINIENSPTYFLHILSPIINRFSLLGKLIGHNRAIAIHEYHKVRKQIKFKSVVNKIPYPDNSVSVIYSSHFLEHIPYNSALSLLIDCRRALKPGGIIRICVPNLRYEIDCYLNNKYDCDLPMADKFMERLLFVKKDEITFLGRIMFLGPRMHMWMYDSDSLINLFKLASLNNAKEEKYLESKIEEIYSLDIEKRSLKSIYIEAIK